MPFESRYKRINRTFDIARKLIVINGETVAPVSLAHVVRI